MKKSFKIIFIVIVFIIISIIGFNLYGYIKKQIEIKNLPDYYQVLAKQCLQKDSYNCCMASVRAMKDGNHKLSENNSCPNGYFKNTLKCKDSFKWCELVK